MVRFLVHPLLAALVLAAAEAVAQEPAAAPPPPSIGTVLWNFLPMFAVVYLIFHFLVFRPQAARERAQRELQQSLKKGDQVVTSGGIIGRVAGTEGDYVLIEISNNVRVKIEPAHVTKRLGLPSEQKKSDQKKPPEDRKADDKKTAKGAA